MPDLSFDSRHLDEDGCTDQYRWHMVDTNLLESDIDEALGRGCHLDHRIARKVPVTRRRIVRRPHTTQASATSSCPSTARGGVGQGATTGVGVAPSHRL